MRIAINCRSFLNKHYAGIGRYAYNLVQSLGEIDPHNEYWLYVQKKYFDFKKHVPRISAKNFTVKIDWLGRGADRILNPVDIYHSTSPDVIHLNGAKILVTVHDLIYKTFPQGHTPQTIETSERHLQAIAKSAARIICCSQSTLNDLCRYFPATKDRVSLVYQGVDKNIFYPLDERKRLEAQRYLKRKGITEPFILFVGTIEPRKNLQNLLRAYAELKAKKKFSGPLVVVGMKGWMVEIIRDVLKELHLKKDIIFLGYVSDDVLRGLYNLAEVFVFPSFYEGFGFPIVEAFCCGAAVVTSNVSSCPEIASNAALTVHPDRPHEIAEAMARLVEDRDLRAKMQARALERARDFSFRKTAEETLKVYQDVFRAGSV